jgi:benzoyl-CoA oxygenase B subunit
MNVNIMNVDYSTKIPNNVNLGEDRQVLKALEGWHPGYMNWWGDMGPEGFQQSLVYLRTAYSVDPRGWAKFDYVKMPDYRWGILLAPQEENRVIPFGQHFGEPAWQEVPGEHRAMLRRLIVIQGDTEPASVEQQRHLGKTAPSLYDLRNLFQVNVEEGRHLWAMVYLLQKYFGRDGREEADELRGGRIVAPPLGRRGLTAHAGRLQRGDAGLAVVLHVHLFHRPRRQDAAALARAIRLRSVVAHLPLHADRGSPSHVRRRDRHQPDPAANR